MKCGRLFESVRQLDVGLVQCMHVNLVLHNDENCCYLSLVVKAKNVTIVCHVFVFKSQLYEYTFMYNFDVVVSIIQSSLSFVCFLKGTFVPSSLLFMTVYCMW